MALSLFILLSGQLHADPVIQIFILHSYSQDYPLTEGQHAGFMKVLAEDSRLNTTVSIEYLDTKRHVYDDPYANEMARHLQIKHQADKPAAIYVTDDNALIFARDHLTRIFPGTPVFFSGVNDEYVIKTLDPSLFTGVIQSKEVAPNLEWLLRIDKNANDLIFVGDNSSTYKAIEKQSIKDLIPFNLRAEFVAEKRLDLALEKIRDMPSKYLFLTTLGGMTDKNGQLLPLRHIIRSLAQTERIIISMEDAYIREGVLGGYVTCAQQQGMTAARMLLDYEYCKPVASFPPLHKSPNALMFDDRMLLKFDITLPRSLRAQAVILNPRLAFYDKHRSVILGCLMFLAVLLCVVSGTLLILSKKNRALARARNNAESATELYHQIAEQSRTVSWEVNAAGLFTYVSPVAHTVLGYQPEELIEKKYFFDLLPDEKVEPLKAAVFNFFAQKESFHDLESTVKTKDGQMIDVLMNGIPILDEHGAFLGYRGSGSDITRRKQFETEQAQLQTQLTQARKLESIGRLAGGVAHDFNNMLSVILGHTSLIMEHMNPDLPIYNDLQEITNAAERSAELTRQLLAFARKQAVTPKVIDLNQTTEGMLQMLRRLIGEDIDLTWIPGRDLKSVKIDPSQIDQIMANLCVNARDAIKDVGKITIETGNVFFDKDYCSKTTGFLPGEFVMLAVSDDGCGMTKEIQARIFEPFFTTKNMGKGTGLGLATIYGIVKQNNGFVNVYSEPDQGTTFKIYIPAHSENPKQTQGDGITIPDEPGNETILLVEDEPAILKLTKLMLEKLGYTVLTAQTPGEAIRIAENQAGHIHLLMTDVVMPEMNGRDLAQKLLSTYPDLRLLFMSGYTANVIAHHGVLDEGIHFMQKPFSKRELGIKVHEALRGVSTGCN